MSAPLLAFVILGLFNAASSFVSWTEAFHEQQATYLRPGEPHIHDAQTLLNMLYVHNQIQVYCQPPMELTMWNVFQSNRLRLQIAADGDYSQYKGATVREVHQAVRQLDECHEGKPLGHSTEEPRIVTMATHDHACYGIYTVEPFVLTLEVISCDLERVTQFTFGLVLWLSCPLLADSLLAFYCSAASLGAHLAGVLAVAAALMSSDRERHLRLGTLKVNFKLVLKERPTATTLALIGGAWLLKSACQRFSFLWRRTLFRRLHHRLLRATSYWLIFTASDHRGFGWTCLMLLIPWPELLSLISWLNTQCARYQRCCLKPTEQWEIVSQEAPYQGSHWRIGRSGHDNLLSESQGSFNPISMRFYHEQRQDEQNEHNDNALVCESCPNCHGRPSTWSCFNRCLQMSSTRNPPSPEPHLTTLYRNLHYSNSESSSAFQ
ncbi:uncharacterized protein LOC6528119 [Drosophila yakuba]|uniref:Uncharacterized protein n=1 Tax=Drosophila yakuba TaxID=7245 RepID=B4P033_DROYA|nr:uncharacterized protein LOC6528119 [Drosophila yakuba]EDW88898.1 uncharacterized protein Dyak_GE18981 [Drosophila yakuba]